MMKNGCIHPGIMEALSLCGHGDRILIADANYPLASKTGDAKRVWLGLKAGQPTVTDVLATLLEEINIEAAAVMDPADGTEPAIFSEFEQMLPDVDKLNKLGRYEFYDARNAPGAIRLAISTGEKRVFANILITVGVA